MERGATPQSMPIQHFCVLLYEEHFIFLDAPILIYWKWVLASKDSCAISFSNIHVH